MSRARPLVGVLGGGQLARMLALSGHELGVRLRVVDPAPDAPAREVAEHLCANWDDPAIAARLADCDVVTYEFERVPVSLAEAVARRVPVWPPVEALAVAQDRVSEKERFRALGLRVPRFRPVDSLTELERAVAELGLPAVLKTRREGYDGKGQRRLRAAEDLAPAFAALSPARLVLEEHVAFEREVSVLAARGREGAVELYPLVANRHERGILVESRAPAPHASAGVAAQAHDAIHRLLDSFGYVGVLALELFQVGDTLLASEIAPRVHNSGHLTIEGTETSQFENHLRAVVGWPLGSAAPRGPAVMLNLIGELPAPGALLACSGAHLHDYGKDPRPGRKVGHVTVTGRDSEELEARLAVARPLVSVVHAPE